MLLAIRLKGHELVVFSQFQSMGNVWWFVVNFITIKSSLCCWQLLTPIEGSLLTIV